MARDDYGKRAREFIGMHRVCTERIQIEELAAKFDATYKEGWEDRESYIRSEAESVLPKPQWKPGQMLIREGHLPVRLLSHEDGFGWRYEVWKGKWEVAAGVGLPYGPSVCYEPYPRVGDLVRCTTPPYSGYKIDCSKPWSISRLVEEEKLYAVDEFGGRHAVCLLEPASPPAEKPYWERPENQMEPVAEQPKPPLEGPHWDDILTTDAKIAAIGWRTKGLRAAVRELQTQVALLRCKP